MLTSSEEDRLLLVPGPSPVDREILAAMAIPTISHTSGRMAEIFREAIARLRTIAGCAAGHVFVCAGSGTLAQESAILNFVDDKDRLLVASNGYFAGRLAEIATCHGLNVHVREAAWGTSLKPGELAQSIEQTRANVVAFTHVETSTGAMAPLSDYIDVIREAGAFSIVDGVAAFGGVAEDMDALGIDILLSGAQKALGVPPGLSIVITGERAWQKRVTRAAPLPAYYADLVRWQPVMEQPDKYFSTHPVNMIYALSRALEIIEREGLANRYARHLTLAERFRRQMLQLGFSLYTDAAYLAPTLTVFNTPDGLTSSEFRSRLAQYGVVAAGGIGDSSDRIVRFGHMGNISGGEIAVALDASARAVSGADGAEPI